jgi:hypothetical protein
MHGVRKKLMQTIPILFNQSLESLRRIGAPGGKACACNRRARRVVTDQAPVADVLVIVPVETTAQAIARLDEQFPWLCVAQRRAGTHI